MEKTIKFLLSASCFSAFLLSGCLAKTPPKISPDNRQFSDHEIGISIALPEGWEMSMEESRLFVAYFRKKGIPLVTLTAVSETEIPFLRDYLRITSFEKFPRRLIKYTQGKLSKIKMLKPKKAQFGGKPLDEIVWAAEREGIAVIVHSINLPLEAAIIQLHFEFSAKLYNNPDQIINTVLSGITILPAPSPTPEQLADTYRTIGEIYKSRALWGEAGIAFRAAVKAQPDRSNLHVLLGESYFEIESFDRALETYNQAVALDMGNAEAHKGLGETHLKLGHIDEGIAEIKRGLALTEDEAPYYLLLGNAYLEKGTPNEAIRAFQKLIRKKKLESEGHLGIGKAYLASELYDQAVFEFKEVLRSRPEDRETHCLLEKVYTALSASEDAAKSAAHCNKGVASPS